MTDRNENDNDLVSPQDACPRCGERHLDDLVWIDDETVRCMNCGTRYKPLKRSRKKGGAAGDTK